MSTEGIRKSGHPKAHEKSPACVMIGISNAKTWAKAGAWG